MAISIKGSVGEGGANKGDDIAMVQSLLNKFRTPELSETKECPEKVLHKLKALKVPPNEITKSLKCWPETIKAIREFQKSFLPNPDGKIDPGGQTWRKLVAAAGELGQGRSLILTFDDGPEPVSALKEILNTLVISKIKAEFYVEGVEVKSSPEAAKLIVTRGHRMQNHTYSHPKNLAKMPKEEVRAQLTQTQDLIKQATGITPTKVRPPYGSGGWPGHIDKELGEVANELSLKIVNWEIDTRDWANPKGLHDPKKLEMIAEQFWHLGDKKVLTVLMHVQNETATDLPAFILQLKKWGFTFNEPN